MQGYILRVQKVKDEDCIVYILTNELLVCCYRFYGARHSKITLGYKLDFELENSINFLPSLKNTMHLGYNWLLDRDRLLYWQGFIRLFYNHLKDLEEVNKFYFEILDQSAIKIRKQNPKRVFLESYIQILKFEGRLHDEEICFFCDKKIESEKIALARAFLPAHEKCIGKNGFIKNKIYEYYKNISTINLDDEEVDKLYEILKEGF